MRTILAFLVLSGVKLLGHLFFGFRAEWLGGRPANRWSRVRLLVLINHTSLYEPVFASLAPFRLLWHFARHGVLPVAEKTIRRRIGLFFRFLARHVVVITRQRDHTWDEVMNRIDTRAVVMILPEGRMMRPGGLDASGRPMTIRSGIADILDVLDDGQMIVLYSGGLHHVQAPGELLPRPFRTVRARLELLDIDVYKRSLGWDERGQAFRKGVVADLTKRRDTLCPVSVDGEIQGGEIPHWRGWWLTRAGETSRSG